MSDTNTTADETQQLLNKLQSAIHRPHLHERPLYQSYAKTLMDQPPSIVTPTPTEIPVDDLNILPEPTTYQDEHQSNLPSANGTPIGFELWEALAYDLALAHADPVTIAQEYDLTTDQLEHLRDNEYFAKMLKSKQEEVAQLGSQAAEVAFTVKMRMLANRATPEFLKRLTSPTTSTKDFTNLFKLTVDLAQLNPTEQDETNATPVIGASVVFNISGVPGLSHLQTAPQAHTIDAEYTDVSNGIVSLAEPELGEL